MNTVQFIMSENHRHCDDLFAAVEQMANDGSWASAGAAFATFSETMLAHFEAEEAVLFPAFEAKTGSRMGPTQVMRNEHAQMRELIEAADAAILAQDAEDYLGFTETLLIMMQQHNLKEENVLYPMCDQHLAGQAASLLQGLDKVLRK